MPRDSLELLDMLEGHFNRLNWTWLRNAAAGEDPVETLLAAFRAEGIPLEGEEELLRVLHLLYLYRNLDARILALAVIVYAQAPEALPPLLEERVEEALTIAAHNARRAYRLRTASGGEPVKTLLSSYHLDVGVKVVREIVSRLSIKK